MKRFVIVTAVAAVLAGLLLAGCIGGSKGVTVFCYDGSTIPGELVSADFQKEELVIRDKSNRDLTIKFADIQRVESGYPARR